MQSSRKKKQTFKIKNPFRLIIALAIVIIIIACAINLNKGTKTSNEPIISTDVSLLDGIFIYNNSIKYLFNKDNTGILYDNNNEYEYTYKVHDQQVTLTFKDETIHQATYTFYFINDDLKLIGGTGTVGGEFILKKGK